MTLQQLRYTVTVAEEGTISAAAEKLFVSQPSLTSAVRELEKELGIVIFQRTNRGVVVSREGDEFLGYARQVLLQTHLLEERYSMGQKWESSFPFLHSTIYLPSTPFPISCSNTVGIAMSLLSVKPLPMKLLRM